MRHRAAIVILVLCAGCPGSSPTHTDAAVLVDAQPGDAAGGDAPTPYRNTIVIDGTNDFATGEMFPTTSSGYATYLSWSEANLYVGFSGADVATDAADSATKWVMVYFDVDPDAGIGATAGEQYNTQQPGFPPGFGAEYYFRWKSDDSFEDVRMHTGGTTWTVASTAVDTSVTGTFMEVAIPLTVLGNPSELGIVSLMVNETPLGEWSYAGLYPGSFADGYYDAATAPIPITSYLLADFASANRPNDAANRRP